ncbi:MAG: YcxB family protein [Clostridia bacterium]|nr:YcxB family protein [Clostridia bacterium]
MKNEYKITKDLINSWAKEYYLHGARNIFLFILWCIVGIAGLLGLILSVVLNLGWIVTYLYALLLIIAVYKLFIHRFVFLSKSYKLYATTYGVTEWMRTTEFLDEEMVVTDHTFVSRFKYSNIQKIKEKDNVVMIFMNDNMALRLYKDAFIEGSWEECKKMILEKKKL